MILSSATHQFLSYMAHDKQLPAQLPEPCRPQKRRDEPLCAHTYDYLNDKGKAGDTLLGVGNLKEQIRNTSRLGSINRYTRFAASHWMLKNSHASKIVISKRKSSDQPRIDLFDEEAKEARLKHRLNDLGRDYGLQIDNTGSHTVLKHLNGVEMKALLHIVERDAPECVEDAKKFRDGTKFNYRALHGLTGESSAGLVFCMPSYYRSTTPEPVTESQLERPMEYWTSLTVGPPKPGGGYYTNYMITPIGVAPPTFTGEGETVRRYVK
ncbi:MAG: hypothetical protein JWQ10_651 [Herbaspirillum sp.]|jgi:hypothetical protein|nr:hypothetical protein [Herbaspirillum sp.]